ncbi:tryptophan halogenase family protein [Shewanella japonica]|uniref:tryptophan halogenase family protein n=1 Tax=Shewanella japonica TaxID=93973 RepID=UPI0024957E6E|nr:tryptophan halogenase family protein [Shewanella japonica]
MTSTAIKNIVIVGGGTAGWLTAAILASKITHDAVTITLIESPDIATIGVGEGTWPSMRQTLQDIGISEAEFLTECDASFKQASKFINWNVSDTSCSDNSVTHSYYHPFSLISFPFTDAFKQYQTVKNNLPFDIKFADAMGYQTQLCQQNLAPKQISTPEYQFVCNYGYHLDAAKFANLLKQHCVKRLKVSHIAANVIGINNVNQGVDVQISDTEYSENNSVTCRHGHIESATIKDSSNKDRKIQGDLFIDCSGQHSLLLGQHYKIPLACQKSILFNDSAIAVQIPNDTTASINSSTLSTAVSAGWIWDIGLQTRRGVGHVYSSSHQTKDEALTEIKRYIATSTPNLSEQQLENLSFKHLAFSPGFRRQFWHKNCVAVGMSAGFIEPLEASAIALVEQSAIEIAQQFPTDMAILPIVTERFNERMKLHWQQIIEFLKLHYVLSKRRDSQYWCDHQTLSSVPDSLKTLLNLWQHQLPSAADITHVNPLFPSASYQYVYMGMKETTTANTPDPKVHLLSPNSGITPRYIAFLEDVMSKRQTLSQRMKSNRELLDLVRQQGFSAI